MKKLIEMENPKQKRCPKCGRRRLREILGERTGKFVGFQCKSKSCYHWWCPNPEVKFSLKESIEIQRR